MKFRTLYNNILRKSPVRRASASASAVPVGVRFRVPGEAASIKHSVRDANADTFD